MSEGHLVRLLYSLLCSLKFLHSAGIIHRDIKPSNILLNENWTVTLCDFGYSRTQDKESSLFKNAKKAEIAEKLIKSQPERRKFKRRVSPHAITRAYRPPEVILLYKQYNHKVDLWSSGVVALELVNIHLKEYSLNPFTGDSCFPLSPVNEDKPEEKSEHD